MQFHTKSGVYYVKYGYELLRENKLQDTYSLVDQPSITSLYRHVWSVRTLGKMKHFMWQALTGCIAMTKRLALRHLGTDRSCLRCGNSEVTITIFFLNSPRPCKSRLYQAWTYFTGGKTMWLIWNHLSTPSLGSYGTFGRREMKKF